MDNLKEYKRLSYHEQIDRITETVLLDFNISLNEIRIAKVRTTEKRLAAAAIAKRLRQHAPQPTIEAIGKFLNIKTSTIRGYLCPVRRKPARKTPVNPALFTPKEIELYNTFAK